MRQNNKLKLLIITDFYYPHWTGISKAMLYLVKSLEDIYKINVLTTRFDKTLLKKEVIGKTTVMRASPLFSFSRTYFSPEFLLKFFLISRSFDVIFINSPCTYILPVSILSKLLKKKLIMFHQGDLILPRSFLNRIIEKIFDFSTLVSFFLADKVATYTEDYALSSRVLKPFKNKLSSFIVPITKRINGNKKSKVTLLLKSYKEKNKILFGFAGRFVQEKGFDILFQAIPEIIKSSPDAHFFFAGSIDIKYENFFNQTNLIYQKVKHHITLLGLLQENDLSDFYHSIDFIIAPSRSDCFNLTQAEAMMAGKPAVVSDIPGLRMPVKQTGFGLIFEKENYHDLAQKIIKSILIKNLFLKSQVEVNNYFSYKKNVKAIREYIED